MGEPLFDAVQAVCAVQAMTKILKKLQNGLQNLAPNDAAIVKKNYNSTEKIVQMCKTSEGAYRKVLQNGYKHGIIANVR